MGWLLQVYLSWQASGLRRGGCGTVDFRSLLSWGHTVNHNLKSNTVILYEHTFACEYISHVNIHHIPQGLMWQCLWNDKDNMWTLKSIIKGQLKSLNIECGFKMLLIYQVKMTTFYSRKQVKQLQLTKSWIMLHLKRKKKSLLKYMEDSHKSRKAYLRFKQHMTGQNCNRWLMEKKKMWFVVGRTIKQYNVTNSSYYTNSATNQVAFWQT